MKSTQVELLELLLSRAWAIPSDSTSGLPFDANYQKAVKNLQASHTWKENKALRSWLSTFWLSIPEVVTNYT